MTIQPRSVFPFRVFGLARNDVLAPLLLLALSTPRQVVASESAERAEQLFASAQACLERGDWACACEAFSSSMAAEPSASTELNLAKCEMHEGKLAAALRTVQAALERNAGASYADESRRRALADYGAKLSRELEAGTAELSLELSSRPAGLEVTLDGNALAASDLEAPFRVDPGSHEIRARAKGHTELRVWVAAAAGSRLDIPIALEAAAETNQPKTLRLGPREPAQSNDNPAQVIAGWTLGATGVAALGTSLALGIVTVLRSQTAEESQACQTPDDNDRVVACNALRDDARAFQTGTLALAVPGAVLLGVGITLLATAPSGSAPTGKMAVSTRGFGLSLDVDF